MILLAVDHGLDGEAHARFQLQLAAVAVVQDLRLFVELGTDAVAAVVAHHGETGLFDDGLDHGADLGDAHARTHLLDGGVEAILGNLAQLAAQGRGLAHDEHGGGVAVVAILDDGDVQVDDVPFPQLLVVGNAVADHVVDRGADGLGEAVVIERCGNGLLYVDDVVMAQGVQFVCGDACLDVGGDHDQHVGSQLAGNAHLFNLFRCLDFNGHGISLGARLRILAMTSNRVMKNRCVCNQGEILSPTPVYFQCDRHRNVIQRSHPVQGSIFSAVAGGVVTKLMV